MTGPDLRARRRALALTQAALATRLGVTPNTIARWERGELRLARPLMVEAVMRGLRPPRRRCDRRRTCTS